VSLYTQQKCVYSGTHMVVEWRAAQVLGDEDVALAKQLVAFQ